MKSIISLLLLLFALFSGCSKENSQQSQTSLNVNQMATPINKFTTAAVIGTDKIRISDYFTGTSYAATGVNNYGYLYNYKAITDARFLAPAGWRVSTTADWTNIQTYFGGSAVAGQKLKEAGTTHWITGNTGTNEAGTGMRGAGYRKHDTGVFWKFNEETLIAFGDNVFAELLGALSNANSSLTEYNNTGKSVYLTRTSSSANGTIGTLKGNDGKVYGWKTINGIDWMTEPLAETKYRTGEAIPGPTWTNAEWAALTTDAYCAPNGDLANAGSYKQKPCQFSVNDIWVRSRVRNTVDGFRYTSLKASVQSMTLITPTGSQALTFDQKVTAIDVPFWIDVQLSATSRTHFDAKDTTEYTIEMHYDFWECGTGTQVTPTEPVVTPTPVELPATPPNYATECPVHGYTDPNTTDWSTQCPVHGYVDPSTIDKEQFCDYPTKCPTHGYVDPSTIDKEQFCDYPTKCPTHGYVDPSTIDKEQFCEYPVKCPTHGYFDPDDIDPDQFCTVHHYTRNAKLLIFDTMTIEDFRNVAAERLDTEPEKLRVDQRVVNFVHTTGNPKKEIELVRIADKSRTVAYVKNLVGTIAEQGAPTVQLSAIFIDKDNNTPDQEYNIWQTGTEGVFQTGNMFAEKLKIDGTVTGQAIVYYAERQS